MGSRCRRTNRKGRKRLNRAYGIVARGGSREHLLLRDDKIARATS